MRKTFLQAAFELEHGCGAGSRVGGSVLRVDDNAMAVAGQRCDKP